MEMKGQQGFNLAALLKPVTRNDILISVVHNPSLQYSGIM